MVLKVQVPPDLIDGGVDEGYGKVADAFRANFAAGNEVGAAVAVYRDGVKVVDLWGGLPRWRYQGAVATRHYRQRLFDDERRRLLGGCGRRGPRFDRLRRARRRLLARVRPGR